MTFGRWLTFAVCLVAAMAVGIWISPYVRGYQSAAVEQTGGESAQSSESPQSAKQTAQSRRSARSRTADTATATNISLSAPELHAQLKPLLNKGANMNVAAQDFRDAEQFAAVAHAARNTEIPFMVLKHRVVSERKPLATAIREFKPDVDAAAQAKRAQAEARADMAALAT
jgi:hypothetical protein